MLVHDASIRAFNPSLTLLAIPPSTRRYSLHTLSFVTRTFIVSLRITLSLGRRTKINFIVRSGKILRDPPRSYRDRITRLTLRIRCQVFRWWIPEPYITSGQVAHERHTIVCFVQSTEYRNIGGHTIDRIEISTESDIDGITIFIGYFGIYFTLRRD